MTQSGLPSEGMNRVSRSELSIPYGWYCIGYGDDVVPLGVVSLRYFGEDLVLFRGADGVASLVDAHCPHLGAHLGSGRVDEKGLRCPFHSWAFDRNGRCVDIPYAKRIPKKIREAQCLATYPLEE